VANNFSRPTSAVSYRYRFFRLWLWVGWALIGLVLYLSLTAYPPEVLHFAFADKWEHLLAYSVLMGWFGQLFLSNRNQIIYALGFCLMGVTLEFVQGWGGHRFFDVADMAANTLGVLLGWWLTRAVFAGFLLRVDQGISRLLG
jgi:VanZ family protein